MATIQTRESIGTKRMISSDLPYKDGMLPDLQWCPLKLCIIKHELELNVFVIEHYQFLVAVSLQRLAHLDLTSLHGGSLEITRTEKEVEMINNLNK